MFRFFRPIPLKKSVGAESSKGKQWKQIKRKGKRRTLRRWQMMLAGLLRPSYSHCFYRFELVLRLQHATHSCSRQGDDKIMPLIKIQINVPLMNFQGGGRSQRRMLGRIETADRWRKKLKRDIYMRNEKKARHTWVVWVTANRLAWRPYTVTWYTADNNTSNKWWRLGNSLRIRFA